MYESVLIVMLTMVSNNGAASMLVLRVLLYLAFMVILVLSYHPILW